MTASATWRRWVCAGHVDQHPGAALGRQPGCINGLGGLQGSSCVAELDRDGDLEQLDVGRAGLHATLPTRACLRRVMAGS